MTYNVLMGTLNPTHSVTSHAHFTSSRYQNVFILDLLLLRMTEVVSGDNWSYKTCKAAVKSSPPTNQHPVFLTGRMQGGAVVVGPGIRIFFTSVNTRHHLREMWKIWQLIK